MDISAQIENHMASQPEPKQGEMRVLHALILEAAPGARLWFDEGKDEQGKTLTNPTIGYGLQTIKYADGKTREFFRIGLSANKTGFSVYILGLKDKAYLAQTYGAALGRAKVTGYCIRFNKLKDINAGVLAEAVRYGINATAGS